MRRFAFLLILAPALAAASAPLVPEAEPVEVALKRARGEAVAADAEVLRLEQAAARARDEASRLRAQQAAAAEAIAAAEARISVADAETRIIAATLAAQRQRLLDQQRPVGALLAGLAMMARRPPLLALADGGSTDEFVRVRLLLDASLPVIRQRTAALSAALANGERLERSALAARTALTRGRNELADKRRLFAALEARAVQSAEVSGGAAIGAGDVAIAAGEDFERLAGEAGRQRSAAQLARELAGLGGAPGRPLAPEGRRATPPFAYQLPAAARVIDGLGEVNASGVKSRGLTLATARGAAVAVPAAGIIRFAGPFRDYDGIVIIDHGAGWMSLIVNVATQLPPGTKVRVGDRLGRALGPLGVELSRYGRHWSPALIAGSSPALSNMAKGG